MLIGKTNKEGGERWGLKSDDWICVEHVERRVQVTYTLYMWICDIWKPKRSMKTKYSSIRLITGYLILGLKSPELIMIWTKFCLNHI